MTDTPPETGHWWKRHWVTVVIIATLIYLTVGIWQNGAYYADNRQQADSAADQYRAYAERTVLCDGIEAPAERYACLAEAVQAEQQRLYAAANLRTQQDLSRWSFATLWLSFGLLVVTGVGVTYVALTLDQTRHATKAAVKAAEAAENTVQETRRIGEAQVRAYLNLTRLSVVRANENEIHCKIRIQNSGNSPASFVSVFFEIKIGFMPEVMPGTPIDHPNISPLRVTIEDLGGGSVEKYTHAIQVPTYSGRSALSPFLIRITGYIDYNTVFENISDRHPFVYEGVMTDNTNEIMLTRAPKIVSEFFGSVMQDLKKAQEKTGHTS